MSISGMPTPCAAYNGSWYGTCGYCDNSVGAGMTNYCRNCVSGAVAGAYKFTGWSIGCKRGCVSSAGVGAYKITGSGIAYVSIGATVGIPPSSNCIVKGAIAAGGAAEVIFLQDSEMATAEVGAKIARSLRRLIRWQTFDFSLVKVMPESISATSTPVTAVATVIQDTSSSRNVAQTGIDSQPQLQPLTAKSGAADLSPAMSNSLPITPNLQNATVDNTELTLPTVLLPSDPPPAFWSISDGQVDHTAVIASSAADEHQHIQAQILGLSHQTASAYLTQKLPDMALIKRD